MNPDRFKDFIEKYEKLDEAKKYKDKLKLLST